MEAHEIEQLTKKSEQDLLEEWFKTEMYLKVGGDLEDLAAKTPDLRKLFSKWSKENLRDLVCNDWGYCQKRKTYGKTVQLVAQLGEFINSNLQMPMPIPFSLAVLIVMHGFDQFCHCEEDA